MAEIPINSPLISQLSKGARAALPFLRSLANTNLTKTEILQQLRLDGGAIRTQTGLDLIDYLRDKATVTQFTRTFGPNQPIPIGVHKPALLEFAKGAKYQYLLGTNSTNPLIPGGIYINSLVPLSENEIFAAGAAAFHYEQGGGMAAGDISDVFFSIDDARVQPGELETAA